MEEGYSFLTYVLYHTCVKIAHVTSAILAEKIDVVLDYFCCVSHIHFDHLFLKRPPRPTFIGSAAAHDQVEDGVSAELCVSMCKTRSNDICNLVVRENFL